MAKDNSMGFCDSTAEVTLSIQKVQAVCKGTPWLSEELKVCKTKSFTNVCLGEQKLSTSFHIFRAATGVSYIIDTNFIWLYYQLIINF